MSDIKNEVITTKACMELSLLVGYFDADKTQFIQMKFMKVGGI